MSRTVHAAVQDARGVQSARGTAQRFGRYGRFPVLLALVLLALLATPCAGVALREPSPEGEMAAGEKLVDAETHMPPPETKTAGNTEPPIPAPKGSNTLPETKPVVRTRFNTFPSDYFWPKHYRWNTRRSFRQTPHNTLSSAVYGRTPDNTLAGTTPLGDGNRLPLMKKAEAINFNVQDACYFCGIAVDVMPYAGTDYCLGHAGREALCAHVVHAVWKSYVAWSSAYTAQGRLPDHAQWNPNKNHICKSMCKHAPNLGVNQQHSPHVQVAKG